MAYMLRTTALRPLVASPLARSLVYPTLSVASRRALTVSAVLRGPALSKDQVLRGSEGPHKHDTTPTASNVPAAPVTGDWVLFHPVYTPEELKAVQVLHREAKTFGDRFAAGLVRLLRWGFDVVSLYRHRPIPPGSNMSLEELRKGGHVMTESQWLLRILFLETIAGVPGFVAAMIRHLRSLRIMKRDSGWISTLLEEAENERMHLMTFMTLKEPSIWFRLVCLGAQGVFANIFFFSYLISPRICHRFVGSLEEEATLTYTRVIKEMELGRLPEWSDKPAPAIAIDYWRLKPDAKLLDVMYAVRSDETTHRFVNHTLANLDPKNDLNPFAITEPDMHIKGSKSGFDREEAAEYFKSTQAGDLKK